jgi:hypothetical protein
MCDVTVFETLPKHRLESCRNEICICFSGQVFVQFAKLITHLRQMRAGGAVYDLLKKD